MGVIFDLLTELNEMDVVLEAEDITSEVEAGTDQAMGKSSDGGGDEALAGGTDNSDGEIDTNTDDILGTTDDNEAGSDDSTDGGDADNMDMDDTEGDGDLGDGESDGMDDEAGVEDSMEEQENPIESIRKKKIHKQLMDFYDTLNDDIKIVNEYVPRAIDDETIKALTSINNNLVQCKEYTYKILTEEFNSLEYPVLLKKYVAMNRVYDLCIRALQTYFDAKRDNDDKKINF